MKKICFFVTGILSGIAGVFLYLYVLSLPHPMAFYLGYRIYGPEYVKEIETFFEQTLHDVGAIQADKFIQTLEGSLTGPTRMHQDPP